LLYDLEKELLVFKHNMQKCQNHKCWKFTLDFFRYFKIDICLHSFAGLLHGKTC